jgi:uncharacterized RDD family membrane protein YckC
MSGSPIAPPPGWYPAQGDPPGTQRYWNGSSWEGRPRPIPGVVASDSFPLADLSRRLVARLIDLVLWVVMFAMAQVVTGLLSLDGLADPVAFLAISFYETYLVANGGATVGKKVVDLQVVKTDGSPADITIGLRRASLLIAMIPLSAVPILGPVAGFVLLLVGAASLVMVYADNRGQTVWDKIAPSLVVIR